MNKSNNVIYLTAGIIIGILICFIPNFITGRMYDEVEVMGPLLVGELLIRCISMIVGLFVIYDTVKNFFKKFS
ncbi:Uncharacterised protein [Streptococcus pneumoniae]|nr:Uncharacterised protein [Streptococcus pneumoniae]